MQRKKPENEGYLEFKSHWIPRSRKGKLALLYFVIVYLLVEWPVLKLFNSIDLLIFGFPILLVWLSGVYVLLMLGLLYIMREGL